MSHNHVDNQRHLLHARLLPEFQNRKLRELTPAMVEHWLLELRETTSLSAGTVNRALNCLKVMLKEAVRRGHLQTSPAQHVARLPETPRERSILGSDDV